MADNMSQKAARGNGENAGIGAGPEEFPRDSQFEGANKTTGPLFGDRSSRTPDSGGQSLAMGLSERMDINGVSPTDIGMGRDESNGKPYGPMKGPAPNGGAGAKTVWG